MWGGGNLEGVSVFREKNFLNNEDVSPGQKRGNRQKGRSPTEDDQANKVNKGKKDTRRERWRGQGALIGVQD